MNNITPAELVDQFVQSNINARRMLDKAHWFGYDLQLICNLLRQEVTDRQAMIDTRDALLDRMRLHPNEDYHAEIQQFLNGEA